MSLDSTSPAPVFAALGDAVRLKLVARLSDGRQYSITQLAEGIELSRQGVTKHLHVLNKAGIVSREIVGRESRFTLQPDSLATAQDYLARASAQWDDAITRLKTQVEG
jgi:DNA-binding transcriptional ArsR family regulator